MVIMEEPFGKIKHVQQNLATTYNSWKNGCNSRTLESQAHQWPSVHPVGKEPEENRKKVVQEVKVK